MSVQSTFSKILVESTGLGNTSLPLLFIIGFSPMKQSFLSPSFKTAEQILHNHWMNYNTQVKICIYD